MSEQDVLRRILDIEYKLFQTIREGHRPKVGDQYHDLRIEVSLLRCMYYGLESNFCKK